jgi:hypothetical protein
LVELHIVALGVISALGVIIPGFVLLLLIRGVKVSALKNLSIMLASFGIVHGIYHLLLLAGIAVVANVIDLISVIILVIIGVYYNMKAA